MPHRFSRRKNVQIDLTPLIDVVLMLIIFFMLTSTFVQSSGIDVRLPEAGSQVSQMKETQEIKVGINKEGTIFWQGQPIGVQKLRKQFQDYQASKHTESILIIEADHRTSHGQVVEIMDIAKSAGLHRIAIATQPVPSKNKSHRDRPQ